MGSVGIQSAAATRVNIVGVGISPVDMDGAVQQIEDWIATGEQNYVCIRDVHGVIRCQSDDNLREIHRAAGMVTPDGMPLVWMARKLGYPATDRVYGPDLMQAVSKVSATRGYRQFYYGGNEGIADRLKASLCKAYPGLQVVGTLCPPFRKLTSQEDADAVAQINAAKPDIVWVGLSSPKQEHWMAEHLGKIDAPVMIGVGAAFDFLSGTKTQAPRWIQRSGFEWLFRLATEPRRLWQRYLHTIPAFVYLAGRQLLLGDAPSVPQSGKSQT